MADLAPLMCSWCFLPPSTADPWTTRIWSASVHFHMDFFPTQLDLLIHSFRTCEFNQLRMEKSIVTFPSADVQPQTENAGLLSSVGWTCPCEGPIVVKFWRVKGYMQIFNWLLGEQWPNLWCCSVVNYITSPYYTCISFISLTAL